MTTAAREHQGWRAAQPFNGGLIGLTLRVRPGDRLGVTIRNGTAEQTNLHYRARGLQDVVVIPKNGGEVVVRHRFEDFTGHFVFHCHILGHEDAGMMQTVQVLGPGQQPTTPPDHGHAASARPP